MYQSDTSSDLTSQLLSIKEIINNKNLNSIQALASFILENNFATSHSDILGTFMKTPLDTIGTATSYRKSYIQWRVQHKIIG
ncbi:zinc finger MYM-type protein 1-like [Aphis craccivora]|uniref:Zinc finger MYM-type protein 1-like n=1 Tax=Aphis craccivora TaxID=307492 RepID=A0A6G0YDP4_APHCR|nr:zinc finger MYM-type protein 1-like [Aphis craccivora]